MNEKPDENFRERVTGSFARQNVMHTIGADALRKACRIVDNESDVPLGADPLQRLGEPHRFVLVDALDAKLECRDRPGIARYYGRLCDRPAFAEHVMVDYADLRADPL